MFWKPIIAQPSSTRHHKTHDNQSDSPSPWKKNGHFAPHNGTYVKTDLRGREREKQWLELAMMTMMKKILIWLQKEEKMKEKQDEQQRERVIRFFDKSKSI